MNYKILCFIVLCFVLLAMLTSGIVMLFVPISPGCQVEFFNGLKRTTVFDSNADPSTFLNVQRFDYAPDAYGCSCFDNVVTLLDFSSCSLADPSTSTNNNNNNTDTNSTSTISNTDTDAPVLLCVTVLPYVCSFTFSALVESPCTATTPDPILEVSDDAVRHLAVGQCGFIDSSFKGGVSLEQYRNIANAFIATSVIACCFFAFLYKCCPSRYFDMCGHPLRRY